MGAINKLTNQYEYPRIAEKTNTYICPDCKKDVILRKGDIRSHHFAHYKSINSCVYYERPGESQIHKDAKMAFKLLLEENNIHFKRVCKNCKNSCKYIIDKSTDTPNIQLEHHFIFKDSRKKADIAYLDGSSIKYIFEICYKHKTHVDNRPEPWFEIDAEKLLYLINTQINLNNIIEIDCIRNEKCNECIIKEKEERDEEEKRLLKEKEEREKQLLKEKEEREKRLLKEKEERDFIDARRNKSAEIKKIVWSEHKKCSKCKVYDRCKKCVEKLWKRHDILIKEYVNNQHNSI